MGNWIGGTWNHQHMDATIRPWTSLQFREIAHISQTTTGRELQQRILHELHFTGARRRASCRVSVQHGATPLALKRSLLQQGIIGEVTLSYVLLPVNLYAAWRLIRGLPEDEWAMEGITELDGIDAKRPLPESLEVLTFGDAFNSALHDLPSALQSLTLGEKFNQCLEQAGSQSGVHNVVDCRCRC